MIVSKIEEIDTSITELVKGGLEGSAVETAASYLANRKTLSGYLQTFAQLQAVLEQSAVLTAAAGGTTVMANPLFPLLVEGKTAYDIKKRNMTPWESVEETGEFFKGYVESFPKQLDNITVGLLELPNTIMMLPDTVPAGIIDAAEYLNQNGIKGTASDIWNTVRNQFQTKVRDFVAADAREKGNMTGNAAIAAADAALATAGVIKVTKSGKIFGSLDTLDDTLHTVKRAENVMDDALDSTKKIGNAIDDAVDNAKEADKIENAVENVADEAADAKKLENVEKSGTGLGLSSKTIDQIFTDKSINHLEKIDGFNKKHGGIKGAHTMKSFNKFSEEVRPVQILSKTKVSDGIYEINYKVARLDKGEPIINADGIYDFINAEYVKTVVDTSELNVDTLVSMAKEAFETREIYITLGNQIYINGITKNGVKFEGWINPVTKELDSFYPVKEWQINY